MTMIQVFLLAMMLMSAAAFVPLQSILVASASSTTSLSMLDGLKGPAQSYADIWTPAFKEFAANPALPDFLFQWGHGAAMTSVLLSMGLIGAYMGWQIRLGYGNDSNALTLGETIRKAHPKIIGGAFFFFFLGGQGGLVLKQALDGGEILGSPHALTGIISLSLLAFQAVLPKFFAKGGQAARDVHTFVGTATMALLFVHMANGIQLGLSF